MKRSATALLLLLALANRAHSQSTDGPLAVDARLLKLQTDSLAVYLLRGADTTRTGTIVDQLRSENGRLVRVHSRTDRVLGDGLDTIVSSIAGLLPVSYRTISMSQIAQLTFTEGIVSGWLRLPNGDSSTVRVELPNPVYDGNTFDLIVRASPLAEGFRLSVPTFLVGPNTVTTLKGSVAGSAVVDGRSCWVFTANFAGLPVTFWVDKETRVLRQQLMQFRADMSILIRAPSKTAAGGRAT